METPRSRSGDLATPRTRVCSFSPPIGWEPCQSEHQVTGGGSLLVTSERSVVSVFRFTSERGGTRPRVEPPACRRSVRRPTPGSLSHRSLELLVGAAGFAPNVPPSPTVLPEKIVSRPPPPSSLLPALPTAASASASWFSYCPLRRAAAWLSGRPHRPPLPAACPLWAPLHFDMSQPIPRPFWPVDQTSCHATSTDTLLSAAPTRRRDQEPLRLSLEPPCSDRFSLESCLSPALKSLAPARGSMPPRWGSLQVGFSCFQSRQVPVGSCH